jgi:hypothetical protein
VREEAIYSRGRLAGGWSAGRQVVCLRHNRTGRTCDTPVLIDLGCTLYSFITQRLVD